MIALLLISIAAICKALADNLAWKYDWFILKFPKLKSGFWKINVTHKKVSYFASLPLDAWHLSNSLAVCCWMALPFVYKPWQAWYIDYPIGGLTFVLIFNLFYNKIFR